MPKVMLVEDDETLIGLLQTLLKMEGFEVAVPQRGSIDHLTTALRQTRPEVILMDVHMHGANGLDLLRQIRGDPDLAKINIIMTSGMDLEDQCLAAGANSFLLKPFIPDELVHAIHQNS